jgi:hypothetical protein
MKRFFVLILFVSFFIVSLSAQEVLNEEEFNKAKKEGKIEVLFESILKDASCSSATDIGGGYTGYGFWTLKFEDGHVVAVAVKVLANQRETLLACWEIGKKYVVYKGKGVVGALWSIRASRLKE